ncbi:L-rhamnose-H+ transport protein [Bryocella elongata]|uniref:L-rhamnose-H+ transport protein n=2 Tax=Bryocella elongata TaxID=863522 RepID=A0A1H6B9V9_9BACT|nr:L-rhamnose-H+ transport protein [Bryocella elongata]
MTSNMLGIGLALTGGLLVGNCMLPLRRIRRWPWECSWLVFSIVSLAVVPCLSAWIALPHWPAIYLSTNPSALLPPFLLGMGWGVAQVLFGLAVVRLGMALGFTLIVGLGTIFGTLIPFFAHHESNVSSKSTIMLFTACALMVLGVVLSGWAGRLREAPTATEQSTSYGAGLLIAVIAGVLSSMLNLSLSFGHPLAQAALRNGAAPAFAVLAVWPIALAGGLIPNAGYSLYLLARHRTWSRFKPLSPDLSLSILMGLLWITAVGVYGLATYQLGRFGDSAGWAIYQVTMVVTACAVGVLTGEWKSASRSSMFVFGLGILALTTSVVMAAGSTKT